MKPDDVFNMNWLFYPILIVVLGGTGTVFGPVIGAFIVSALFAYGDVYFAGYHTIMSGLLIILVMLFMPEGLMGVVSRVPRLWHSPQRWPERAAGPPTEALLLRTRGGSGGRDRLVRGAVERRRRPGGSCARGTRACTCPTPGRSPA